MEQQKVEARIMQMAAACGETEDFVREFLRDLASDEKIMEEFVYYLRENSFLCREKIAGYSVVDILVFQMDHFKATMDRAENGMKTDGNKMVLRAFRTFLNMRKNPEPMIRAMQGETGTDYPGKYN